jgi:rhomboid protease GluP
MFLSLLALLGVLGFVFYVMSADERTWALGVAATFLEGEPRRDRYLVALRERTRWALVTPAVVALNVIIFLFIQMDAALSSNPNSVVAWGGNFGPHTTSGEWWRLVISVFVHGGMLHLIANTAGLFQLGLVVERLVGPLAFASVYLASGILANLAALSQDPLGLSAGASGAVFGIYGLLISTTVWTALDDSSLKISRLTVKRLAPAAAIFVLYNVATDNLPFGAELAGFVVGVVGGGFLGRGIGEGKPALRRIGTTAAAALVIAAAATIPLHGVDDVRPEIERVIAVEERTANAYETALERFRKGRISAEALALVIDNTIAPDLQATDAHLKKFDNVPAEHQPLMASAAEYLRLRRESWRLRAEGLRKMEHLRSQDNEPADATTLQESVTRTLKQADRAEHDSLAALQRIKPAVQ